MDNKNVFFIGKRAEVLIEIYNGEIRMSAIQRNLDITQASLHKIVHQFKDYNLINLIKETNNKRRNKIIITERGLEIAGLLRKVQQLSGWEQ